LLLRLAHGVPDDIFCVDVGCKAKPSNVRKAKWMLLVFLEGKLYYVCHATPHLIHTVYILKNSLNVANLWACCENELQPGRALVEVELILVRLVELKCLFAAGTGAIWCDSISVFRKRISTGTLHAIHVETTGSVPTYLGLGANRFAKDLMENIIPYMSLNSC
jgi:hypothetical protein